MLKNRFISSILVFAILISVLTMLCPTELCANTPDESFVLSSGVSSSLISMYNAKFQGDNCTHFIYFTNGGINSNKNPEKIKKDSYRQTLILPHKFGYVFMGWYLDSYFTKKITALTYSGNQTIFLYAKWSCKYSNEYMVENYNYKTNQKIHKDTMYLKDCSYSFLDEVNIPGMPDTKESDFFNNLIYSKSQCPQGLCFAKDYILTTSYSEEDDCLGEVMVFDKESGSYLITLGMDPESHLGGIAFDGQNIWVCNSSSMTIERISYDFIDVMAKENNGQVVDATSVVDIYKVSNVPSCITYYKDRLWIASCTKVINSKLVAYHYDENNNKLSKLSKYTIPCKVQGVTFDDNGRVFLSTSYGREKSSYLKIYNSVVDMSADSASPDQTIEMPPCSEEIDYQNEGVYVIFESAGEKYFEGTDGKGKSPAPIDKILRIKI